MIAHIKGGQIIRRYHEGKGRATFENGKTVSPPAAGVYGDEQLVPIIEVTVDNSTTTRTTRATVEVVEADRVLRTMTIADVSIEELRAGMSCTKMQGVFTLGEIMWGKVISFRDNPTTTLIQKEIINSSDNWTRNSEDILFFGHLLNYTPEQIDDLFRVASGDLG
jgi:hypothetical protein